MSLDNVHYGCDWAIVLMHSFRVVHQRQKPKDRVYYVSESVMKASTSINKDNLLHCGTCLGKFTKSGKFRLHITALDYLAQYSKVSLTYLLIDLSIEFLSHPISLIDRSIDQSINQSISQPPMKISTKYGLSSRLKCHSCTEIM